MSAVLQGFPRKSAVPGQTLWEVSSQYKIRLRVVQGEGRVMGRGCDFSKGLGWSCLPFLWAN